MNAMKDENLTLVEQLELIEVALWKATILARQQKSNAVEDLGDAQEALEAARAWAQADQ